MKGCYRLQLKLSVKASHHQTFDETRDECAFAGTCMNNVILSGCDVIIVPVLVLEPSLEPIP